MSRSRSLRLSVYGLVPIFLFSMSSLIAPYALARSSPAADRVMSDQIIVTWADSPLVSGPITDTSSVGGRTEHVAAMSNAAGMRAAWTRPAFGGGNIYRLASRLTPDRMAATLAQIRATPGVLSAEADPIATVDAAAPNDTYFATGQWDLTEGTVPSTYGIDLLGAWDVTRGNGVTIGVVDTGITVHPDLAGQTVPGYDMISNATLANDGDLRDPDPSDPGDWCNGGTSTWHGTHVTGTLVALANNGIGIAGIAPAAHVQMIRGLGTCGGYFSDLADALVWASGGSVSGVPANPTPDRVVNMSLGGTTPCPSTMQTAINTALSRGTVVVVAAGNSGVDASTLAPANCVGVIVVAATDRTGARANFSNYGSLITVAAPGVGMWSTVNSGATTPVSPTYAQYSGTSMATPHVAGVIAPMIVVIRGRVRQQVLE